ncbi:GerAB/ArcD/ProY family transporter [Paenibacillus oleatilyticus]|uniref:Endospore germination permease n=1 Tax=Paenibacillus oleatilyticus TaxID=2594886 RepID=A0ABV4UTU3_9BACL
MKKYTVNEINLKQFTFTIYKTQIGIGILSLPRDLSETAGMDGWISLLLGWLLAILFSVLIIKVMEKHPEDTLFDIFPKYFGKWLGGAVSVLWILYTAFSATIAMISSIHIIQVWILPNAKEYVLMPLFMIPVYMATKQGVRVIGRFGEFVFLFTLWMPMILFLTLYESNWLNLIPVGQKGWLPILTTVKATMLSFLGFEITFMLYPFLQNKKAAYKGVIYANTISMLVFMLITVLSYVRFSHQVIMEYLYPTLNLLKLIRLPILERFEIIFLAFYLFILFATVIPYLYMSVFGLSRLTGKKDHVPYLRVYTLIWLVLPFFFVPSFSQITALSKFWGNLGLCAAVIFPVLFWAYQKAFLKLRKGALR